MLHCKLLKDRRVENEQDVQKGGAGWAFSGHHMMFLEFKRLFPEARFSPVFYKGAADQNAALLGGEVDLMFGNINDVMRSIDEFNVLNVASEERNAFLPEVPTLKEQHVDFVSDIDRNSEDSYNPNLPFEILIVYIYSRDKVPGSVRPIFVCRRYFNLYPV